MAVTTRVFDPFQAALNASPETVALIEAAERDGMQLIADRDPHTVALPQLVTEHDALEARVSRIEKHLSGLNHDRRMV